jgi:hypothetical protein
MGVFTNLPDHIAKLVERLGRNGSQLSFCYEAGPCGYGLRRQLTELGHGCIVVAPSLIPMKAGDREKTDQRDAVMLAKLHRAGELTSVWVPDEAHEAMRDLIRARATAVRVLGNARHHLQGFFLRHGAEAHGGASMTRRLCAKLLDGSIQITFCPSQRRSSHPKARQDAFNSLLSDISQRRLHYMKERSEHKTSNKIIESRASNYDYPIQNHADRSDQQLLGILIHGGQYNPKLKLFDEGFYTKSPLKRVAGYWRG